MKRSVKNIISILIIVLMAAAMLLTNHFLQADSAGSAMPQPGSGSQQIQEMGGESQQMQVQQLSSTTQPEKPDSSSSGMETPPEKPDGDSSSMEEPPEKPDGESSEMPSMGGGESMDPGAMQQPTSGNSLLYHILIGIESLIAAMAVLYLIMSAFNRKTFRQTFVNRDKVTIYILAIVILTAVLMFGNVKLGSFAASSDMRSGGGGSGSGESVSYTAVEEITSDTTISGKSFSSTSADENAVIATGDIEATLTDVTVTKSGDSDGGDSSSFYGNNSAVLTKSQAALTLKHLTITTDADGANGVFSYGGSATTNNASSDGTEVTIRDSSITTTGDNSGGIMTTGGGITNAYDLTINTSGVSSAAIRSDRGGGTVNVEGGTYTTTGAGSPAVYSTAEISVRDAKLISKAAEGVAIEGANSISLENCTLTDNNTKLNGLSTTYKNVFLYQSMSGDADAGEAVFSADDCTITTKNGDSFYVTNTTASISLSGNTIKNTDKSGNFLRAQADSWGTEGSNGGNVTLSLSKQKAVGNIVIDSVSSLKMNMTAGSYYEGTINGDNEAKSIALTLDSESSIKLTGDSYVSSLSNDDSTYSNIDFNGYKLYVNGKAIN